MDEKEFQKKVLDGTEALAKQNNDLVSKFDNLDKETKKAFEELTKLKNAANDQAAIMTAIQKVQIGLQREQRMAFGDPVQRISADDGKRARFNALVRRACLKKDESLSEVHQKAMSEASSPGSTYIINELAKDIYDSLARFGAWNTLGVRQMGTRIQQMPVKTVRPIANFILTEGTSISDDANKAGVSVNLQAELIGVLLNISRQLIDDDSFDITADVMDDFIQAWNYRLDFAAFQGAGTADATNGGMTGLFPFATASVATTTHTTCATLTVDDFIKCLYAVDPVVLQRAAKWWVHPSILAKFIGIKDANGRPIFLTALEAPSFAGIGSILGYPVVPVQAAPSTDALSNNMTVFGDPQAMVVGIRTDFAFEASDDFKWDAYQRSFRGVGRAGVKGRKATALVALKTAAS